MTSKVVAVVNLQKYVDNKLHVVVPWGTEGTVVGRYEWSGHCYIDVKFDNGETATFGDEDHPLTSYKGKIQPVEHS